MNILEIENRYNHLKEFLAENISKRSMLLKISEFFSVLLSFENQNRLEAYISEFIHPYFSLIKDYEIRGINPNRTEALRNQLFELKKLSLLKNYSAEIDEALSLLEDKLLQSDSWLRNNKSTNPKNIIYFPVLEHNRSGIEIGYLETLYIDIKSGENKFHVTPAEAENDVRLQNQLEISWKIALKYCCAVINRIKPAHTVNLHFENRLGVYVGNSLGIALTLAFIEAILKHYNSPTIIKINGMIAVTGGVDNNSKIISTSRVIIEAKVETVFYSDAQIFCVPKIDELWAEAKLSELKNKFPERNLKIIGLMDLEDLLSRRNVVEIHKRNIIDRVVRYALKKWKSILLAMVLTLIFIFLFALDFDTNPAMFEQKGNLLNVQNKNGKTLWVSRMNFSISDASQNRINICKKLVDINNDGINEVILSEEEIESNSRNYGRVACFDNEKNLIWQYNFRDTVSTFRKWTDNYHISIIDTATISTAKILLLMARNIPNFPNAIFYIDLITGKRIDSTKILWNAGGITNGISGDFNNDGIKELILAGMHNGFEKAILFSVNLDKLKGQTPAPERYIFYNIPKAELNTFILLPHTDYGKLFLRSNIVPLSSMYFASHSEEIVVSTMDGDKKPINIYYGFDKNLNFLWVDCADNAQKYRDSLVAQHILNPPYTNTSSYSEILKNEIKYWTGNKFVSIVELNK